jgi:tRNA pseudouridine55 synthase
MARQRTKRRENIDGVLLLNKPHGLSSNQALQRVKRHLNAAKAGHTGSLDPAATGMLPLCFGEATKASAFLLDADKCYRVEARLGVRTDSGDATGVRLDEADVPQRSFSGWADILRAFRGESEQVPPMYSALKKDGKRLYELARRGETVERAPRRIRIDDIVLLEAHGMRLVFRVWCSKGTYIRTLVEDIAAAGGTIAYTRSLHRESVAAFRDETMLDLNEVEASAPEELCTRLLPPDVALAGLPALALSADEAARFALGQRLARDEGWTDGLCRVYGEHEEFLGVGEVNDSRRLSPKRIFALRAGTSGPLGKKHGESPDFPAKS